MNQDTHRPSTTANEVDPFVKRVVTVKPGDVVIFRYDGHFKDQEEANRITEHIGSRMGAIPFLVVNKDFDVTVLKQSSNGHGALIA